MSTSSRGSRNRFRYDHDDCAFIELDARYTREWLIDQLYSVPGVYKVENCSTKFSQNNPGTKDRREGVDYGVDGHYLQQNVKVISRKNVHVQVEFELTRCGHSKSTQATVTMCFKPPPAGMLMEAWRILREAAGSATLHPDKVDEWYQEVWRQRGDVERCYIPTPHWTPRRSSSCRSDQSWIRPAEALVYHESNTDAARETKSLQTEPETDPASGAAAAYSSWSDKVVSCPSVISESFELASENVSVPPFSFASCCDDDHSSIAASDCVSFPLFSFNSWYDYDHSSTAASGTASDITSIAASGTASDHSSFFYYDDDHSRELNWSSTEKKTRFAIADESRMRFAKSLKDKPRCDVRYRRIDEDLEAVVHIFHCKLHESEYVFDLSPFEGDWISKCWRYNLDNVQRIRDCSKLRAEYAQLLWKIPITTHELFKNVDLSELASASAWQLVKLLEYHRGEVVQVSHHDNEWVLMQGHYPQPHVKYEQQLLCDNPKNPDWCWSQWENSRNFPKLEYAPWLRPKWREQRYSCVVPCEGSHDHYWIRRTICTTLGHLFTGLGKEYTAAKIYKYYMSRKLVVQKVATDARRNHL